MWVSGGLPTAMEGPHAFHLCLCHLLRPRGLPWIFPTCPTDPEESVQDREGGSGQEVVHIVNTSAHIPLATV